MNKVSVYDCSFVELPKITVGVRQGNLTPVYNSEQIPFDAKKHYSDESILYMLDLIVDYYYESGILESTEEEIDIDMEKVAAYVCEQSLKQGRGELDPQEVSFVVEADLDFQEQA